MLRRMGRFVGLLAAAAAAERGTSAWAQCLDPAQTLNRPAGAEGLGRDVAIEGEVMAIAHHSEDRGAGVLVYELEGGRWHQEAMFTLVAPAPGAYPIRIDLSGDRIVAGVGRLDRAWVLRRGGGGWSVEAVIESPGQTRFADDVAISGETILIGDPYDDSSTIEPGAVHVYRYDGAQWAHDVTLASPDPGDELLGLRVALDGPSAAVMARRGEELVAIMYREHAGEWSAEAELALALGDGWYNRAGQFIDLDGDRLIVAGGSSLELAQVHHYNGVGWELEATLEGPHRFGTPSRYRGVVTSVALHGDQALAIYPTYDGDLGRNGVAYFYRRTSGGWELERRLLRSAQPPTLNFGESAAIHGPWATVGAAEEYSSGSSAVFAFDIEAAPGACPEPTPAPENGLRLLPAGPLTPQTPSVRVRMEAFFPDPQPSAFISTLTTVRATEPQWSEPVLPLLDGDPGVVAGREVSGVSPFQFWFFPIMDNPIAVWEATFGVDDFSPRVITVRTDTRVFEVHPDPYAHTVRPSEPRIAGMPEAELRLRVWRSSCLGDCDGSGELDFGDFLCFQNLFAAANPVADLDDDGELTFFDFLAFQNAFAGGCP